MEASQQQTQDDACVAETKSRVFLIQIWWRHGCYRVSLQNFICKLQLWFYTFSANFPSLFPNHFWVILPVSTSPTLRLAWANKCFKSFIILQSDLMAFSRGFPKKINFKESKWLRKVEFRSSMSTKSPILSHILQFQVLASSCVGQETIYGQKILF